MTTDATEPIDHAAAERIPLQREQLEIPGRGMPVEPRGRQQDLREKEIANESLETSSEDSTTAGEARLVVTDTGTVEPANAITARAPATAQAVEQSTGTTQDESAFGAGGTMSVEPIDESGFGRGAHHKGQPARQAKDHDDPGRPKGKGRKHEQPEELEAEAHDEDVSVPVEEVPDFEVIEVEDEPEELLDPNEVGGTPATVEPVDEGADALE